MWCFLGKYTKRKSLKPDLYRQAVTKQSPRKNAPPNTASSLAVPTETSANTQYIEPSQLPDVAVVTASQEGESNVVEEDALRARRSPSYEDVKEALENIGSIPNETDDGESEGEAGRALVEDMNIQETSLLPPNNDDCGKETNNGDMIESSEQDLHENSSEQPVEQEEVKIASDDESRAPEVVLEQDATPSSDLNTGAEAALETTSISQSPASKIPRSTLPSAADVPEPSTPDEALYEEDSLSEEVHTENSLNVEQGSSPLKEAMVGSATSGCNVKDAGNLEHEDDTSASHVVMHDHSKDTDENSSSSLDEIHDIESDENMISEAEPTSALEVDSSSIVSITNEKEEVLDIKIDTEGIPDVVTPSPEQTDMSTQDELGSELEKESEANLIGDTSEASQATQDRVAIAAMPVKTTRSGTRFSDDTNLLKDFLNRAKARKMVQDIKMPANETPTTSPRRSPRKALAECANNSPSPPKAQDLANRPGTPPGKQRLDAYAFEDVDELTAEPRSIRRSARTRLPAPAKAPPGAPSFIPVRRADGADPVILQKSEAQELAVQTRANTRRNKGQSKPPTVALQNLTAEMVESMSTRVHMNENSKSVGWDDRLVYHQETQDAAQEAAKEEGKEEKRPKVRRLRGLGAANGTPAPKRMADVAILNGTPAPRRRGKLR